MLKKTFCLMLAGVVTLSLASCGGKKGAEAPENDETPVRNDAKSVEEWDMPEAGIKITVPQEYKDAKGMIEQFGGYETDYGSGIVVAWANYATLAQDEYYYIYDNADDNTEEGKKLIEKYSDNVNILFYIAGINGGRGWDEINKELLSDEPVEYSYEEIGRQGDYVYYMFYDPAMDFETVAEDYRDEYIALYENRELIKNNISFYEPVKAELAEVGAAISFETTDVNGEAVSSADIFAENKITMVNLWQSWCGPCVQEMPELDAINDEYKDKGAGVIGILLDGDTKDGLADGLDIIKDTGIKYTVLITNEEINKLLPAQAFPTTYFVDGNGNIVGNPVVGANVPKYKEILDELLAEQ